MSDFAWGFIIISFEFILFAFLNIGILIRNNCKRIAKLEDQINDLRYRK